MQTLLTPAPPQTAAKKHLLGWTVFSVLVLAAAAFGALGGLLFVYSTDLPQVEELERYRPSSIT